MEDGGKFVGVKVKAKIEGGVGRKVIVGLLEIVGRGCGFVLELERKCSPQFGLHASSYGGVPAAVAEGEHSISKRLVIWFVYVDNVQILVATQAIGISAGEDVADSCVLQPETSQQLVAVDGDVVDKNLDVREEAGCSDAGIHPHERLAFGRVESMSVHVDLVRWCLGVVFRVLIFHCGVKHEGQGVTSKSDVLVAGAPNAKVNEGLVGQFVCVDGGDHFDHFACYPQDSASVSVDVAGHVVVFH